MSKFHTLTVADITRETADCVSVSFEISAANQADFKYIQGQYLTLKLKVNGEEIRRSYSISSSPVTEQELRIAVKKVKDGRASGYINDTLKVGDKLEVMTPMGNFYTPLLASNKKNYVLFAGGSGITPMLSILKSALHAEPQSTVVLLYGNQEESAVIFNKQIAALQAQYSDRFKVVHVLEHSLEAEGSLHRGIMMPDKVKALIDKYVNLSLDNEFFICGPTPMMKNVEATLIDTLKIAKAKVHLEYFTATLEPENGAGKAALPKVQSQVTIIMDGDEHHITLASDGPAILDAALDADLDVPFACKGAVCCTCRAKLIEGQVHMDMNYALSEAEVAQGYILTCQSHPITDKVVVDYDA